MATDKRLERFQGTLRFIADIETARQINPNGSAKTRREAADSMVNSFIPPASINEQEELVREVWGLAEDALSRGHFARRTPEVQERIRRILAEKYNLTLGPLTSASKIAQEENVSRERIREHRETTLTQLYNFTHNGGRDRWEQIMNRLKPS